MFGAETRNGWKDRTRYQPSGISSDIGSNAVCLIVQRMLHTKTIITSTAKDIEENISKSAHRHSLVRASHSKSDKDKITGWNQELDRMIAMFSVSILLLLHLIVSSSSPISSD